MDVLAKGFWFANGVALSADETYVVVADSIRMSLHKVWVKVGGARAQAGVLWLCSRLAYALRPVAHMPLGLSHTGDPVGTHRLLAGFTIGGLALGLPPCQ